MNEKLAELYAYKTKYEKEKLFAEAKIAVVEEMIADEKSKVIVDIKQEETETDETVTV